MIRPDKLTVKLQSALGDASSIAVGRDHQFVEGAHLLTAMIEQQGGTVHNLLAKADVNVILLRSELGKYLDTLPTVSGNQGEVALSQELLALLNQADGLAQKRGDQFISSEMIVLAAVDSKKKIGQLLREAGATRSLIEQAIDRIRGGQVEIGRAHV